MGPVTLELRCPQRVGGIAADPQLDWSFDTLLLEINTIEKKLNAPAEFPFTKTHSREFSAVKDIEKGRRAFVMRLSDEEIDDMECNGNSEDGHGHGQSLAAGGRFACDELYLSDSEDSGDESTYETQCSLMDKMGLVEGALYELTREHQLSVTEEIRNQMFALETDLMNENEMFTSALAQVEKYTEARREMDRKLDMQYQRRIAEALDNHLTAVQRDHEYISQIEERKIRDDAAFEEAKRKEKLLREEKARQEKMKAEAEARLQAEKKRDEEAKVAAMEAERAAKQTADTVATETLRKAAAAAMAASQGITGQSKGSGSVEPKKVQSHGNILKGAESALRLEERRLQVYKEVAAKNEALGLGSNKEYRSHGMQIARRIKTINGTTENVRAKVDELIKILNSSCPQSISIAMFTEKVVSQSVNPTGSFSNAVYAYGYVIVMVTSQVPLAMEILLAELNRVCILTVPKYISYSEAAFDSKETYYKAIGYQEEDGNIESTDSYVARLNSYMKLYGALVQTEVGGFQNLHGIKEGWAWIARFLNTLPANLYTAVALQAFLEMAGYALFRRYKSQFKKLLNIISRDFLNALKEKEDPRLIKVVMNIRSYIESNQFLKEPEGWRLQSSLLSHQFVPGSEYQEQQQYEYQEQQYHYPSNRSRNYYY